MRGLHYDLSGKQVVEAQVPCGSCHLCCKGDAIFLHPELGDDPSQFETEANPAFPGRLMLAHKPNGDCIYLTGEGCSIHGRAPAICREFDCRGFVKRLGYTQARKLVQKGLVDARVVRRGRELLRETA